MALPQAGEVWRAANAHYVDPAGNEGLFNPDEDGFFYYVHSIKSIAGVDFARVRMIGNQHAGGFYKLVRASYMDASPSWTIQADPIP